MTDQRKLPEEARANAEAASAASAGRTVCVFASALSPLPCPEDGLEARLLGRLLGDRGYPIMLGGRHVGLLSEVYAGVEEAGGRVHIAYLKAAWMLGSPPPGVMQSLIVDPLERLRFFLETADAFIALPGGIGTLNEIAAVIVSKQLCRIPRNTPLLLHPKHESLVAVFRELISNGYVAPEFCDAWRFFRNAEHCVELLDGFFGQFQPGTDLPGKHQGDTV